MFENYRNNIQSVLIISCGALAREIIALRDNNNLAHLSVHCLPAELHNCPDKIAPAVQNAIVKFRPDYDFIKVAYAECGTAGALDKVLKKEGIERINGPHCYAFFSGMKNFNNSSAGDIDVFYLTDFLTRHFENLVFKALGLDRHPELLNEYFKNYTRLVYLAQTDDPQLVDMARDAAKRLNLMFEVRQTGYGDLNQFITNYNSKKL